MPEQNPENLRMRGLQIVACLVSPLPSDGEQSAGCSPHTIGDPLTIEQGCSLFNFGDRGRAGRPPNDYGALHAGCMDTNRASQRCEDAHAEGAAWRLDKKLSAAVYC